MKDEIVILGAGITGLSIGWHLVQQGFAVTILDQGQVGCGASSKAAGMITPASEIRYGEPHLTQFFLESLSRYKNFIQDLHQVIGKEVDFNTSGALTVAIDPDDEAELLRFHDYQKKLGLDVSLLSSDEVAEKEPLLKPVKMGLLAPHECFCDNRLLLEALSQAFISKGGKIIENKKVQELKIENGKLQSLIIGSENWEVSQVVVATGHQLPQGIPPEWGISLRPIKGQALELRTSPTLLPKRAIRSVHRFPVYLVPRSDGRLIVGATTEEVGLDERVTGGAILDLLTGAWRILPAIDEMELTGQWVGFRAATRDHSPILGHTPVEGLTLALGMYRHGILLAPLVGRIMADLIAGKEESEYLGMFSAKRFTS